MSFYPDSHLCYQSVPVKISDFIYLFPLYSFFTTGHCKWTITIPSSIPSNTFCCCDTLTMTMNLFFRYNIPGTKYSFSTTSQFLFLCLQGKCNCYIFFHFESFCSWCSKLKIYLAHLNWKIDLNLSTKPLYMLIYRVHTVYIYAEIKGALYTNKAMSIFVVCIGLLKLCPCI